MVSTYINKEQETWATVHTASPNLEEVLPGLMNFNFCSNIQMVGSECGVNNTKHARTVWCHQEECFQHLVRSLPKRLKAVLKAKGSQPSSSTDKSVAGILCLQSINPFPQLLF